MAGRGSSRRRPRRHVHPGGLDAPPGQGEEMGSQAHGRCRVPVRRPGRATPWPRQDPPRMLDNPRLPVVAAGAEQTRGGRTLWGRQLHPAVGRSRSGSFCCGVCVNAVPSVLGQLFDRSRLRGWRKTHSDSGQIGMRPPQRKSPRPYYGPAISNYPRAQTGCHRRVSGAWTVKAQPGCGRLRLGAR